MTTDITMDQAPADAQIVPAGVGDQPIIEQQDAPQSSPDAEARARSLGWVPQEEFRGDPSRWRSADEFLERGYTEPAIARATIEKLQSRIEAQERTFAERIRGVERMSDMALSRQRDQLLSNYDNAIRQAAEIGDMAKFDELSKAKQSAVRDHDIGVAEQRWTRPAGAAARPANGAELPPSDQAVVDNWVASNRWVTADPEMLAVADIHSKRLSREHPGLTASQNLAEVTRYMQRRYPEKFTARPAPTGAPLKAGNRQPLGRSSAASRLPPEAQAAAQKYIKMGLYKTVDEYAADYNDKQGG